MTELVSFDDLKALVSIEDVASWLGIQTKPAANGTHRGKCPLCSEDRTFTMTPAKGLFGCFKCQKRGSILDLVHFVKRTGNVREAALLIQEHFLGTVPSQAPRKSTVPEQAKGAVPAERDSIVPVPEKGPQAPLEALRPLENLSIDHPAIDALGLSVPVCAALGIGYAGKGMMKGRVVFPLRLSDGTLVGYQGLATNGDQAPLILFPRNLDQRCAAPTETPKEPKKPADELRKLFRVVS